MNAQAILDKIAQDAQESAERLGSEASAKAAALKAESRSKIEAQHAATLAQAQRDSNELEQRMLRMEELEERKALLAAKRALLQDAFSRAGALLAAMPTAEKRAFFIREAARFASGNEALAVSENAPWFDNAFLSDVNNALAAQGKPAKLTLGGECSGTDEGLILRHSGAEIRCTLRVLLEEARAKLEQEAAEALFGD